MFNKSKPYIWFCHFTQPQDPFQCLYLVILEHRSKPKTILGGELVEIALGLFWKKKDILSWEAFGGVLGGVGFEISEMPLEPFPCSPEKNDT